MWLEDIGYSGFTAGIINSGNINSLYDDGIYAYSIAEGNGAVFSGSILNSGHITSASSYGMYISAVADSSGSFFGSIKNTGTIKAEATALYVSGVGAAKFSGSIGNSGSLTSQFSDGMYVSDVAANSSGVFTGTVFNTGHIAAGDTGMYVYDVGATFSGSVSNSGNIASVDEGMYVDYDGYDLFSGAITNTGTITSTSNAGIYVSEDAYYGNFTGTIGNSGAISAYSYGIYVTEVARYGNFTGSITNSGTIATEDGAGIFVSSVAELTSGARFSGSIFNSGWIASTTEEGIYVSDVANTAGTFLGTIGNTGIINVYETGIYVDDVGASLFSGTIINTIASSGLAGHIYSADGYGIAIEDVASEGTFLGTIVNTTQATIESYYSGILFESSGASLFSGNILNKGIIKATYDEGIDVQEVAASGTFIGNIGNVGTGVGATGLIVAGSDGLYVYEVGGTSFNGSIYNSGTILAGTHGIFVSEVANEFGATFTGSIVNGGKIVSGETAVYVNNVGDAWNGGVTNSGKITTSSGNGIYVGSGVTSATGGIVNTGSINAGGTGFGIVDSAISTNVIDAGFVFGAGGTAIQLADFTDNLILKAGYSFNPSSGNVVSASGGELELGGAVLGTFDAGLIGSQYLNFSSFDVLTGARWNLTGTDGTLGVTVDSGGTAIITSGSTMSNGTVDSGGTMIVLSGGKVTNTTVETGGHLIVNAGGHSDPITISGTLSVNAGGTDSAGIVESGGVLNVSSGGVALDTTVDAGGTVNIAAGGVLTADAGGVVDVQSGAKVNGVIQVGNGVADIEGTGSESVSFTASGTGGLVIGDSSTNAKAYSGTISGFGGSGHTNSSQYIDLANVAWNGGGGFTDSFSNGVLSVSSAGTLVASIKFAGSYSTANFDLVSGAGNTLAITDPAVSNGGSANIALLANYMATSFVSGSTGYGSVFTDVNNTNQQPTLHAHT